MERRQFLAGALAAIALPSVKLLASNRPTARLSQLAVNGPITDSHVIMDVNAIGHHFERCSFEFAAHGQPNYYMIRCHFVDCGSYGGMDLRSYDGKVHVSRCRFDEPRATYREIYPGVSIQELPAIVV